MSTERFVTSDGYRLTRYLGSDGKIVWAGDDMEFAAGADGWPVDDAGEKLDGRGGGSWEACIDDEPSADVRRFLHGDETEGG